MQKPPSIPTEETVEAETTQYLPVTSLKWAFLFHSPNIAEECMVELGEEAVAQQVENFRLQPWQTKASCKKSVEAFFLFFPLQM